MKRREIVQAIKEAFGETVRGLFGFVLAAALAYGLWTVYRNNHVSAVKVPWIESRTAPLIEALDRYRAAHGVYPQLLIDAYPSPGRLGFDFIYQGGDRAPDGFRTFQLRVGSSKITYLYSSSDRNWREEKMVEVPKAEGTPADSSSSKNSTLGYNERAVRELESGNSNK